MATRPPLWYFEQFGLIQALNDQQRRQFAGAARMRHFKRGERVYLSGDPGDQIFLVKSGIIKIATRPLERGEVILAFLHPGDIFGEVAVFDASPRDHLAEAHEDSLVCGFARESILQMIHAAPQLGFEITKLIGRRLQHFQSKVEDLLCQSAHARVAHALLDLAERHGVPDSDGVLIPFRLSQTDLGRLVGLRRETVNVILQEWREQGFVEPGPRAIRLRNAGALRRVS